MYKFTMITHKNIEDYIEFHFKYLFEEGLADTLSWTETVARKGISHFATIQAFQGKFSRLLSIDF
jgi:hypothetical protein